MFASIASMAIVETKTAEYLDVCLKLDFYGQMLTEKTRDFLDLHYTHDLSLAEIAENLGVSRQAVHDRIRQGVKLLDEYEIKLKLVERYRKEKDKLGNIITDLENGHPDIALEKLRQMNEQL